MELGRPQAGMVPFVSQGWPTLLRLRALEALLSGGEVAPWDRRASSGELEKARSSCAAELSSGRARSVVPDSGVLATTPARTADVEPCGLRAEIECRALASALGETVASRGAAVSVSAMDAGGNLSFD